MPVEPIWLPLVTDLYSFITGPLVAFGLWPQTQFAWFSALAWLTASLGGLAFLSALVNWARHQPSRPSRAEFLLPLALTLAAVLFSGLALPGDDYRYDGEDASFAQVLADSAEGSGTGLDPLLDNPGGRTMSRIYLAAVLTWQKLVLSFSNQAEGAEPGLGTDLPFGWRAVGLATWALAAWFLYCVARSWGAGAPASGAGVALGLGAPAVLFHANCLSDHLAAAVVIVVGLHLQLQRISDGRVFTGGALLEALAVLAAGFYTRWTSLFLLAPLVLIRLIAPGGSAKGRIKHLGVLVGGAVIVVLPELPRMLELTTSLASLQFDNYPLEEGLSELSLLSTRHLLANLRPNSVASFLAPAGHPAFLLLSMVGVIALWRHPPPGGRRALAVVLVTMLLVLLLSYAYMHPGSRGLLPVALWLSLFIACGLQALLDLSGRWKWLGRAVAGLLLLSAAHGSTHSLQDLHDGWFPDSSPAFERLKRGLPVVATEDFQRVLADGSGGKTINLIRNIEEDNWMLPPGETGSRTSVREWMLPPGEAGSRTSVRVFFPPIVTWSQLFRDNPTVYIIGKSDYGWSTSFQRDYLTQIGCKFDLHPWFVVGPFVAVVVSPKDDLAWQLPETLEVLN